MRLTDPHTLVIFESQHERPITLLNGLVYMHIPTDFMYTFTLTKQQMKLNLL
jgi:hypothetical protein